MASSAQVLASQANAQLSTGPRTAEGKAASSRNRVSHGLLASIEPLSSQDRAIFDPTILEAMVFLDDCKSAKAISRLMRWERAFLRDRDKAIAILTAIRESDNQAKAAADPESVQNRRAAFPTAPLFARTNPIAPQPAPVQSVPLTPRSAPCPCGSGLKFKRCCGKSAPAVLAAAA
ncbi:MAG: SEC-C domain-containing protein [Candidatus Solibacter usitatus]|nr:SEC-C domain-containing protein [Candidatus Solibacter usitatus]